MLEVKGIFKCINIKEIASKKVLTLSNADKDKAGNYGYTYYQIWVNDKVSQMVNPELKRNLTKKFLEIDGFLKVSKSDKYTNLTIFPKSIKEYKKV